MNDDDKDERGFLDRLITGFICALVLYLFSHLSPEAYEARNFIAVLGFLGGFFFINNS